MRLLRFTLLLFVCLNVGAFAQNVTLDSWDFLPDPSAAVTIEKLHSASGWRRARAGLSCQAQFDDLRDDCSRAWYRTAVDVPAFATSRRTLLRFGAVDYMATVYVNGKSVGTHEGGYTPFAFDITTFVHTGANEIAVHVSDPSSKSGAEKSLYRQIPHGKQSWYVQTSGLWQPVTVEFRPATYLDSIRITSENDGRVQVDLSFAGATPGRGSIRLALRDRHGRQVFSQDVLLTNDTKYRVQATVADPELWSPDDPALYTAEAVLSAGTADTDTLRTRFGFRRLEARDGRLFLNGKPFYMIGALDQDFYPETIYSPPSHEYVRREMELAKKLGLNTLRCHIKVCEPEYLDAADEVGILIWYEIPNWDDFTPDSSRRGEETFQAMVARDWNHPSIVIQSIINESWGIELAKSGEQRAWLRTMTERAQATVAPLGRLIVDNSPCCDNFHVRTDLNDFHQYYSIPDNAAKWDAWVADFASRPKWTFSPHGDAQPTGREPLIVSEFGNWGLPQLPKELPWWFSRSNSDIARPAGVYDRFRQFKLERVFRDYDALARETQSHQFLSLRHEIEEMRRYASIQGYIITEFTDLNWESNGLLTMWREPKIYADDLRRIQQPDVLITHDLDRAFSAGQVASANILLSHFSGRSIAGSTLFWHADLGPSGSMKIAQDPPSGTVVLLGDVKIPLQGAGQSRVGTVHLYLQLRDAVGGLIAENSYTFAVYPVASPKLTAVSVYDPEGRLPQLRAALTSRGYQVSASAPVLLATRWDSRVDEYLRGGVHVIVLANSADALPSGLPLQMKERKGDYDGNWISNFTWIMPRSPAFHDIAAGPILGWEAAAVMPNFVLQGIKPEEYDDVLAGMFYGWIHNSSPVLVQARVDKGAALVTTFLFDRVDSDPFAAALLDALVRYAGSADLEPGIVWTR
jgi:hypothetical protein